MISAVQTFGATVPRDQDGQRGDLGEDRWRSVRLHGHTLIVVADGVGSCEHGGLGATLACDAVRQALYRWPGCASGVEVVWLLRLIETLWRLEHASVPPGARATTCMFAVREADGHLLAAGLGDGLCLIRSKGTLALCGGRDRNNFNDTTRALGGPHRLDDWWVFTDGPGKSHAVMLATDGIADDLDPDRYEGLTSWLFDEVSSLSARRRSRVLREELTRWPVPGRSDDRTLAVLVEQEAPCAR